MRRYAHGHRHGRRSDHVPAHVGVLHRSDDRADPDPQQEHGDQDRAAILMMNIARALLSRITRRGESGQAVVELALLMPIMLLLVFGVAELTQAYSVAITIGASTREGARIAGALVNGGLPLGCGGTNSPNAARVDPPLIAAVERVLTASGTGTVLADVTEIRIYKSDVNGNEVSGVVNVFVYTPNND